jgi:LacI family transcriptional regulator
MRSGSALTIRDVAARAGVSVTTVSRVLNNKGDVSQETAAQVRAVIDELGFESSLAARSMRSRRTQVIGLVLPDMDHSYAVEVVKAASRSVTDTAWDLFVMTSGTRSHNERGRWEQQQVSRLNGTLTDGIIVVVPDAREFRTDHPLVAVDPYYQTDAYPSVIADNRLGALEVMRYLFGLGHTRVGYIGGYDYLHSSLQRRKAWEDAHTDAGLPVDPALIAPGDFSIDSGVAGLQRFLALDRPPTAIFAANDDTAFGVLSAARAAGLHVPDDLSVVGFDNVPEAAVAHPPLTTVDQGIEQTVRTAIAMLITLIEGKPLAERSVVLPAHLVIRDSCSAPAAVRRTQTHAPVSVEGGVTVR